MDCLVLEGDSQPSVHLVHQMLGVHGGHVEIFGGSALLPSALVSAFFWASYLGIQVSTADATSKSLCFVRDYWLLHSSYADYHVGN